MDVRLQFVVHRLAGEQMADRCREFLETWKTEVLTKQQLSSARAVKSHLRCYILPQS